MKRLKENKKKVVILILIFIISIFTLFKFLQIQKFDFQEDLIFFKLFNGEKNQNSNEEIDKNEYEIIEVEKGKNSYKRINLLQVLDIKTLTNEKICPGTKGCFNVYLISNSEANYEMTIEDKNKGPKNFKFQISEPEGIIEKNKIKKVQISWEWPYEINEKANDEDTKDGKNIAEYDFKICTIGR